MTRAFLRASLSARSETAPKLASARLVTQPAAMPVARLTDKAPQTVAMNGTILVRPETDAVNAERSQTSRQPREHEKGGKAGRGDAAQQPRRCSQQNHQPDGVHDICPRTPGACPHVGGTARDGASQRQPA